MDTSQKQPQREVAYLRPFRRAIRRLLRERDLLRRLDVNGPEVELKFSTVLAEKAIKSKRIEGLVVRGYNEVAEIALPKSYSRSSKPAKRSQIPRPESALNWPHLKKVAAKIMPLNEDIEVGLLIGLNCSRAIKPLEVIPGKQDDTTQRKPPLDGESLAPWDRRSKKMRKLTFRAIVSLPVKFTKCQIERRAISHSRHK